MAGQQRLAAARITVVGAGGLGSALLPQLAAAGVGFIRLYDGDVLEEHNLHRQTLYRMSDIGQLKVQCAQRALAQLNPDCRVEVFPDRLSASGLAEALHEADLVIDAADNFAITYLLSDACQPRGLPLIAASVLRRQGYVGGFCGSAPGYRAVFPQLPTATANCNTAGVMGPAVATLGALQAQMALSVLLGLVPSPLGCLINCDFVQWSFRHFRFERAEEPTSAIIPFIDRFLLQPGDCVVELRSEAEAPASITAGVLRLSLAELPAWQPPAGRIVLVCASGIRAAQAAAMLEKRGVTQLAMVAAGSS